MKQRRETNKVNPSVGIFDHLTPKNQQILLEAKGFKVKNGYEYKIQTICAFKLSIMKCLSLIYTIITKDAWKR